MVYDVGMNNGDDTEYYLEKGCHVVGIEANPELCKACEIRFAGEIAAGKVKVINCAVGAIEGKTDFYINREDHVQSTLRPPLAEADKNIWQAAPIQVRQLSSIIRESGKPYFIKIDVEYYDAIVLHELWEAKILPLYISAESHFIDVYCHLVAMGYAQFKLVRGSTVHADFQRHRIRTMDGRPKIFYFKHHSSGPFGEDIPGPWLDKNDILEEMLTLGLGWIDIHARR